MQSCYNSIIQVTINNKKHCCIPLERLHCAIIYNDALQWICSTLVARYQRTLILRVLAGSYWILGTIVSTSYNKKKKGGTKAVIQVGHFCYAAGKDDIQSGQLIQGKEYNGEKRGKSVITGSGYVAQPHISAQGNIHRVGIHEQLFLEDSFTDSTWYRDNTSTLYRTSRTQPIDGVLISKTCYQDTKANIEYEC